ncbi:molybdenum cofactor cytidylyltransferase [Paenibacillus endophyticus]|uniref:Molybdenum cofactor cytidylyltransferase n=1 Tax=Paenibacillus endophyticus TaxID=1294268 RepID=A0A7W5C782_9BACL|nr:nucleotidyltransferase family protein [Paenibacillus endophyticus]MBB3151964.1 molybdenum cofactor cytidylyltransferase [Paenibacillus endophyticus]
MNITALYLAAGQSRRMGIRKQTLELAKNKPLASLGLRALLTSPIDGITVVVSPDDQAKWIAAEYNLAKSAGLAASKKVSVVTCAEAECGMSFSIRAGLQNMMDQNPSLDGVLVALADQPFVTPDMFAELVHFWGAQPVLDFVATASQDFSQKSIVLTPPALLSKTMFPAMLALDGDTGARKLFHSPTFKGFGLVAADEQALFDVDTPADFDMAKKRFSGK